MSTSYHPQTDGQTEVVNRSLKAYLRCFAHEQPRTWNKYLCWAEYSFNTSFHTSANTTPFKVVYERDPPPLYPFVRGETHIAELAEQLETRDHMLKLLKENLRKTQDRMKSYADQHCRELTFEVGDAVFLRIQPFRQHCLSNRKYIKLSPRYFSPYKVMRKMGVVAYELELPPESKIYLVFYVSLLRPAHGVIPSKLPAALLISVDYELLLEPDEVLFHRWKGPNLELLIQWKARPVEESSWEDYDLLLQQYPEFHLEDKAVFKGGSDDRFQVTYQRKHKKNNASAA